MINEGLFFVHSSMKCFPSVLFEVSQD
jgi:hypothetical protein